MAYAVPVVACTPVGSASVNIGSPGTNVFDGVTVPSTGSTTLRRILLTNQSTPSQNGVWIFNGSANPLTRPTGTDQYFSTNTLDNAVLIWVQGGNTLAGTCWGVDPAQLITVDTTNHTLTRVALPPAQVKVASPTNLSSLASVSTVDGISISGNGAQGSDLVLLNNQKTASQNGIYWANPTGTMVLSSEPLTPQRIVRVSFGNTYANTEWALVTQLPVQVGTTSLTFSRQFVRVNVKDFGATGNGQVVTDGAMSLSSATLVCSTSNPFASTDVGKSITVLGAGGQSGVGISALVTTISGVTPPSTVTLVASAGAAVAGATVIFGTDDTTAVQAAVSAVTGSTYGGSVFFPVGTYVLTNEIGISTTAPQQLRLYGEGRASTLSISGVDSGLTANTTCNITIDNLRFIGSVSAPVVLAGQSGTANRGPCWVHHCYFDGCSNRVPMVMGGPIASIRCGNNGIDGGWFHDNEFVGNGARSANVWEGILIPSGGATAAVTHAGGAGSSVAGP